MTLQVSPLTDEPVHFSVFMLVVLVLIVRFACLD